MIKKSFFAMALAVAMCLFASPAQAQFKNLGKSLGKAAKDAGKAAQTMATDMALETGANKVSDKLVEFLDENNTVAADDSEYTKRLKTILGDKFTDVEGKALTVKVYESDEANILTLNNGNIRIYSGMMDLLSDDEVKALVALQAGHINSGNIRENLLKAVSDDENAGDAAGAQIEKMLSFSGDKLGSIANELIQVPYTEEQNKEADKFAKGFLTKNGGTTEAYTEMINKFQDLGQIDLEDEELDEESESTIQATSASKFLKANSLR